MLKINLSSVKRLWTGSRTLILKRKKTSAVVLVAFIIGIFFITTQLGQKGGLDDIAGRVSREVVVASVLNIDSVKPLPLIGTVRSQSEAILRTETSGEITGVYRNVGDFIGAGAIIAEIENAVQRAGVLEAEGRYEQAKAALERTTKGTRDEQLSILEINVQSAETSLTSAKISAKNTLLSAYAIVDDAILRKADQMFSNPHSHLPLLSILSPDSQLVININSSRLIVEDIFERQDNIRSQLDTATDIEAELALTESEVQTIKGFLDMLIEMLNTALTSNNISQATIGQYQIDISGARTGIISTLSSLALAKESIQNKQSSLDVALANLEQGITGERSEDIAQAEASLKQARGALQFARANLEKTLIRTPISGTINTLGVSRGEFVSAFELAAVVSNNNALEIRTFITDSDKERIQIGSNALINKLYDGVVTSVASGLDPDTRKIEVRIGIEDSDVVLTYGSSVQIEIEQNNSSDGNTNNDIVVPLSALKILADKIVVFTIDENKKLIAHEVQEGPLLGDSIVILEGITADMVIVLDARGLNEGDTVIVREL